MSKSKRRAAAREISRIQILDRIATLRDCWNGAHCPECGSARGPRETEDGHECWCGAQWDEADIAQEISDLREKLEKIG